MSPRRYLRIALCVVAVLAAGEALASKKKGKKGKGKKGKGDAEATSYQVPYGMAGCGLGSLVFKSDTMMEQVLAATTNGTSYSQTFGISTGSSNCQMTKADLAAQEQEVFLSTNLASLEKDVSAGGGQFVEAFAKVLGCDGTGQYSQFLAVSRANYARIFSNVDAGLVYDQYMQVLRSDETLAKDCERVLITSL